MGLIDLRIAELGRGQHDVVGLGQLRELGVTEGAVRRRLSDCRLYRLFRGAYAVGSPRVTQRGRWKAATLSVGAGAALSHEHAAALRDLAKARGPIDITVAGRRPRSQRGIRIHRTRRLDPADIDEVDGIPVTSVARTFLDLAAATTAAELQRLWERAERLQILDVAAVRRVLAGANGRRGTARLAALLEYDPEAAAQAESELERLFLDLIRSAGLRMPHVGVLVDGYLVDTYWPEANLVVELDGYAFHHDRATWERDHRKLAELRAAGREVLSFTYRQVTEEPAWVLGLVGGIVDRGFSVASS
jgi:very-short-patch-repair endonuclease